MKRFAIAAAALMAAVFSHTASAQVQLGFRAGANWGAVSKPEFMNNLSPTFRLSPGPTGAVFLEIPVSERVSIRPEVQYIQKGFMLNQQLNLDLGNFKLPLGARVSYQTHYVEVPVLAKINLNEGPMQVYLLAGASAGYVVDGRVRTRASGLVRTQPFDIPMNLGAWATNRWDFSGIGGLGLSTEFSGGSKLFAEARYQHGFSRQYDLPIIQLPIRNRGVNVSLGYSFPLGN